MNAKANVADHPCAKHTGRTSKLVCVDGGAVKAGWGMKRSFSRSRAIAKTEVRREGKREKTLK